MSDDDKAGEPEPDDITEKALSCNVRKQFFLAAVCIGMTLIEDLLSLDAKGEDFQSMSESALRAFRSISSLRTVESKKFKKKVMHFFWYQCQLKEANTALEESQLSRAHLREVNAEMIVANQALTIKRASLNRALINENGRSMISDLLKDIAELEKRCEVIGADMREALKEFEKMEKIELEMDKQRNEAINGIEKTKHMLSTLASWFKTILENHDTSYIFEELWGQI